MKKNTKKELVKLLNKIADLMEIQGENPFKIRAFRNGASALRTFDGKLEELIDEEKPVKIKGVGKGILSVISDFLHDREIAEMIRLTKNFPLTVLELTDIKGLGSKKIRLLYEKYGIDGVESLEQALLGGKLKSEKFFDEKRKKQILTEIEKYKSREKNMLLNEAEHIAGEIKNTINNSINDIKRVEITGELRRVREIISKVELIVLINENSYAKFKEKLNNLFHYNEISGSSNEFVVKITDYGSKEILLYVYDNLTEFIKSYFLKTGSERFVKSFSFEGNFSKEREIFKANNINYVIPELREHEVREIKETDSDLCFAEMKGMLHFHTVYSDGYDTLESMVLAGKKSGFEYFAVCDHSKSAFYANGLNEERLIEQKLEIKRVSSKLNVKIMHGNEVDILIDGKLDFSDTVLAELDFVVASVHSRFNLSEKEMTARIIKAVENPFVTVLGHPTGRLLLRRAPYELNIKKVIDACAANGVAIEINANPSRLDLDWRHFDYARGKGVFFTINADAHTTDEIEYTKYGVKIARKGGIKKSEVINYWEFEKLSDFIRGKRP